MARISRGVKCCTTRRARLRECGFQHPTTLEQALAIHGRASSRCAYHSGLARSAVYANEIMLKHRWLRSPNLSADFQSAYILITANGPEPA